MTPDDVRAYLCVQGLKNRCLVDAGFFIFVYQLFVASILYISVVFFVCFPCSISGRRRFIWVKAFSEKPVWTNGDLNLKNGNDENFFWKELDGGTSCRSLLRDGCMR